MNGSIRLRWTGWRSPGPWLALLVLGIGAAAWNTGAPQLYLLALLLLSALLVGALLPHFNIRGVVVSRSLPAEVTEGDRVNMQLELTRSGWLARYLLQLRDRLPFSLEPAAPLLVMRLGRPQTLQCEVTCERRGIHRVGPLTLASDYPLALLCAETEVPQSEAEICVLPQTFEVQGLPLFGRSGFPTEGHQVGPAARGQDQFAAIRDYRHGDSLRHIHWRASARRGEWVVKEYEQLENAELLLVLNACAADNPGEGRESCFEYSVRIAASIARFAIENGHKVGLFCQASRLYWLPPDSGEPHFRQLLQLLAAVQADSHQPYSEMMAAAATLVSRQTRLLLFHTCHSRSTEPLAVSGSYEQQPLLICFDGPSFSGDARLAGAESSADPLLYWIRAGDNLAEHFAV
jgi:uncharacterized protein (DUF58 family)